MLGRLHTLRYTRLYTTLRYTRVIHPEVQYGHVHHPEIQYGHVHHLLFSHTRAYTSGYSPIPGFIPQGVERRAMGSGEDGVRVNVVNAGPATLRED